MLTTIVNSSNINLPRQKATLQNLDQLLFLFFEKLHYWKAPLLKNSIIEKLHVLKSSKQILPNLP